MLEHGACPSTLPYLTLLQAASCQDCPSLHEPTLVSSEDAHGARRLTPACIDPGPALASSSSQLPRLSSSQLPQIPSSHVLDETDSSASELMPSFRASLAFEGFQFGLPSGVNPTDEVCRCIQLGDPCVRLHMVQRRCTGGGGGGSPRREVVRSSLGVGTTYFYVSRGHSVYANAEQMQSFLGGILKFWSNAPKSRFLGGGLSLCVSFV